MSWQLFPGILNEITLHLIAPKLPWRAFQRLSRVSKLWVEAISSRQVLHARVCHQSTETLILLNKDSYNPMECTLYALHDGTCTDLPDFPGLKTGRLPDRCQCICLDGKLYVLGGFDTDMYTIGGTRSQVYVLDLLMPGNWKECASMQNPRSDCGLGTLNGKIYVFGGTCFGRDDNGDLDADGPHPIFGAEVYDPETDVWSAVAPMTYFGMQARVVTMGEELVVHNQRQFRAEPDEDIYRTSIPTDPPHTAEVYHPVKDEWRIVDQFLPADTETLVMVGGNLHKLNSLGIEFYDKRADLWKPSQSFSFDVFGTNSIDIKVFAAVVVGSELLALVGWRPRLSNKYFEGPFLMRSQGLGILNGPIVWQKLQHKVSWFNRNTPLFCPIQL